MQAVLTIGSLPDSALEAAAKFHRRWLPEIRILLEDEEIASLALVLPTASYDHADWRRAAARDLARALAPVRVNIVGGGAEADVEAVLAYLGDAPGVTGQYCPLHED